MLRPQNIWTETDTDPLIKKVFKHSKLSSFQKFHLKSFILRKQAK